MIWLQYVGYMIQLREKLDFSSTCDFFHMPLANGRCDSIIVLLIWFWATGRCFGDLDGQLYIYYSVNF